MKATAGAARILVATDNTDDASQIMRQLKSDFANVRASVDPSRVVLDFEDFQPAVLLLAFDSLEKAKLYYLGLYRLGSTFAQHPHRTVILCNKDEVLAAFELCKKDFFDDYVLYWPHTFDGSRLAMSLWIACREMTALAPEALRATEMLTHAKHLRHLETALGRELADGDDRIASAHNFLHQVEKDIAESIDSLSQRLTGTAMAGSIKAEVFAAGIDELKRQQLAITHRAGTDSLEAATAWAGKLKEEIGPALAGTRVLSDKVQKVRPVVMVVEDDEFARQLIGKMLDPLHYDAVFAGDSSTVFSRLKRVRPDVILMDITLPGVDGLALTRQLKRSPLMGDIPIIMMTGDSRRETLTKSIEAGALAFLVKPFARELLMTKLNNVFSM